jgi:peptidoglycan/xylan/chitin deacetylase (PgdA/CDA1 family)
MMPIEWENVHMTLPRKPGASGLDKKRMRNVFYLAGIFVLVLCCTGSPASVVADSKDALIIEHGRRDSQNIALTFDACPTTLPDEYDEKVVEVLLHKKTPATLFLSGRWVEKNREKTKFLANQPQFEIANHTFWHPHLLEKDDARILRELRRTQTIIRKITGMSPKYFRPPFGEVDERVAMLAKEAALVTVEYDIASGDPDPGLSPRRIIRSILRSAKGGSIIVFHMNRRGVHTAEVLPDIIDGLRKKGFNLVTVGELLKN